MAEPGQTVAMRAFGRYRVFGELGRGAMGVVYRGFDPVIGRIVALKTLFEESQGALEKDLRERLYREAAAAGALSHPNIVTIYDIVEARGVTAVAMEFIEGRSLADILTETGSLALPQALDILEQVCSALDYAASHGVVHRDIKPANILLTAAGQVKITDFGVARLSQSSITQAGMVLGSPNYMSPEQVSGLPVDGRSDLFAASLVFYEMLTRERPFSGASATATMRAIANDPPLLNPSIGSGVMGVLLRAFEKEPDERYPTGAMLISELRRVTGAAAAGPLAARAATSSGVAAAETGPPSTSTDAKRTQGSSASMAAVPAASKRRRQIVLLQGIGSVAVLLAIIGFLIFKVTSGVPAPSAVPSSPSAAPAPPAPATEPPAPAPREVPVAPPAPTPHTVAPVAQTPRKAASKPAAPTPAPAVVEPPPAPVVPPPVKAETPPPPAVEPPAPPPPPPPSGKIFEQTEVDVKPAVAKPTPAEYPPDALQRRVEDVVVLRVLVNATGHIDDVKIQRGSKKDVAFERSALAAVRQYVFTPAQKNGKPVTCWISVAVPFQLPK